MNTYQQYVPTHLLLLMQCRVETGFRVRVLEGLGISTVLLSLTLSHSNSLFPIMCFPAANDAKQIGIVLAGSKRCQAHYTSAVVRVGGFPNLEGPGEEPKGVSVF